MAIFSLEYGHLLFPAVATASAGVAVAVVLDSAWQLIFADDRGEGCRMNEAALRDATHTAARAAAIAETSAHLCRRETRPCLRNLRGTVAKD